MTVAKMDHELRERRAAHLDFTYVGYEPGGYFRFQWNQDKAEAAGFVGYQVQVPFQVDEAGAISLDSIEPTPEAILEKVKSVPPHTVLSSIHQV